ncbi:G-type lectin S-receptor-like serine/threonine-protein kinase At1g34300 [Hordeum vulgare subsp. vulgare]|uniref:Protein kinase domain-containing protein n=1 Tax=Hordeum vulgare subsp. vulgare TaxID=112509 RepID=A0A8I6WRD6_HORVV|nr:G-type lectin S-receptor-like serine/threonine-protein kinase At1g34300 [Hordeum vulgare subsp. vulgare]
MSSFSPPSFDNGFDKEASSTFNSFLVVFVVIAVLSILGSVAIAYFVYRCVRKSGLPAININTTPVPAAAAEPGSTALYAVVPDSQIRDATVERFLKEIAGEKPIRFTPQQLSGFTNSYSARLGAGGFGAVYKGMLPNGLTVAVKRLHPGHDDRTSQEQFMAEVGTIGRTHHINLVRLFGFCYDADVRALVYEYMEHGALDSYLFDGSRRDVGFQTRRAIAVGVARGLRYLHEECQHKIVHYDIKPGNVLLDGALTPKVADFGLAQLLNRADTHKTVSGMRGTPGYAAPEMWMQAGASDKCDVYSFGILLFEILGRRRNFDEAAPESRQWFPKLAWTKYESGELMEVVESCDGAGEQDEKTTRRMCEVAFWCVQQQPEARPPMGVVVKMLEGEMDIAPPANPFQHLMATPAAANRWTTTTSSVNTTLTPANGVSRGNTNEIVKL